MGFLNLFSKTAPALLRLPSGSFTVDSTGRLLAGTLSSNYPSPLVEEIGRTVLATFRGAQETQLPLNELIIHYPALKIIARELRGGAIIFLSPKTLVSANQT